MGNEIDEDALALDRARYYAGWVKHTTKSLCDDMTALLRWSEKIKTQRTFETEFEATLDDAEAMIMQSLSAIKRSRDDYKKREMS